MQRDYDGRAKCCLGEEDAFEHLMARGAGFAARAMTLSFGGELHDVRLHGRQRTGVHALQGTTGGDTYQQWGYPLVLTGGCTGANGLLYADSLEMMISGGTRTRAVPVATRF
jgi:hypothetical protein